MRVLPGMQAAFLDIGLARTAFLHAADILRAPQAEGSDTESQQAGNGNSNATQEHDIRALLREGDELLVQVVKDPLGTKGARLSTHVALPSRFLVYMPRGSRVGVSSRIEDEAERARLRELISGFARERASQTGSPAASQGGYIVRTAALGAPLEALHADMIYLDRLWKHVRETAASTSAGALVHEDLPLWTRVLRDELSSRVRRVLVDSPLEFARMREFARAFMPEYVDRIELHSGPRPIFDLHGVEDEIAQGARAEGAVEVRRLPRDPADRSDDHRRREHRRLRRLSQPRRDDLPHQSRSGRSHCAAAARAQSRRHHHHRLHRHAG